jgi:hypothetical protein
MRPELIKKLKTELTISIPEAGEAIGVGSRNGAYAAARQGHIKTIRTGNKAKRVATSWVRNQLGITAEEK